MGVRDGGADELHSDDRRSRRSGMGADFDRGNGVVDCRDGSRSGTIFHGRGSLRGVELEGGEKMIRWLESRD